MLDRRLYDGARRLTQSGPGYLDSDYVAALTGQELSASGIVTRNWQPVREVHLNPDQPVDRKNRQKEENSESRKTA